MSHDEVEKVTSVVQDRDVPASGSRSANFVRAAVEVSSTAKQAFSCGRKLRYKKKRVLISTAQTHSRENV